MKKDTNEKQGEQSTKNKMVELIPKISIIILNLNMLNKPIKRQRLVEWVKK